MPRKPRHIVKGNVYHLISRFVDREWYVRTRDEREHYLRLLGRALTDTTWRCFGYVVMSNHIHLEALAGAEPLGSWVRRVNGPFADAMNKAHDRIGPMFVRGPKAFHVPPEKVGAVLAYIHNNPVRAGVVDDPRQSDWSSHRAYAGMTTAPPWLHVGEGLERANVGGADFNEWVRAAHQATATKSEAEVFAALELEEAIEAETTPVPDLQELIRIAADMLGLSTDAVRSRRKQPQHVLARRVIAICGDRLGLSGVSIARALGTSPQCVSKILTEPSSEAVRPGLLDRVLEAARRAAAV